MIRKLRQIFGEIFLDPMPLREFSDYDDYWDKRGSRSRNTASSGWRDDSWTRARCWMWVAATAHSSNMSGSTSRGCACWASTARHRRSTSCAPRDLRVRWWRSQRPGPRRLPRRGRDRRDGVDRTPAGAGTVDERSFSRRGPPSSTSRFPTSDSSSTDCAWPSAGRCR